MNKIISTTLFLLASVQLLAQMSGDELLRRTIRYHDPDNNWTQLKAKFALEQTRPNGPTRQSEFILRNSDSYFKLTDRVEGDVVVREVVDNEGSAMVNGSIEFSQEISDKYRLSQDRLLRTRNYYVYLYGLPMKLTDPGTNIVEEVKETQFNGKTYLELAVTYDDEVGSDDWFFYIDPDSYAMEGYKFYHENGKGEYIILEGTEMVNNIKIPKMRNWYIAQDSTFLGRDHLKKAEPIQ